MTESLLDTSTYLSLDLAIFLAQAGDGSFSQASWKFQCVGVEIWWEWIDSGSCFPMRARLIASTRPRFTLLELPVGRH